MSKNIKSSFDLENKELFPSKFLKKKLDIKSKLNSSNEFYEDGIDELQKNIINKANDLLYNWDHVTFGFPPSLTGLCDSIDERILLSHFDEKIYKRNDNLFILPSFNELDEIATDQNGKLKKLNQNQLNEIKKNGEFEVDSIHFPGQKHKWRLTKWLQYGYERSNEYFFQNLSTALKFLIITAKNRIISNEFSIIEGARSIWKGTLRLVDIIIGLPAMEVVPYDQKVVEEEQKFLVAELTIDETEKLKFKVFCEELEEINKYDVDSKTKKNLIAPFLYRTPDNLLIDLRLFDKDLMEKVNLILKDLFIQTEDDYKWFTALRRELSLKLKNEGLSDYEIKIKASELIEKQYFEILFQRILDNKSIDELSSRLGETLVNHGRSILIMRDSLNKANEALNKHLNEYKEKLIKQYPIKSKIIEWLNENLKAERDDFIEKNQTLAHELAIEDCKKNNLKQAVYFLNRELIFRKEHEPGLVNKFKKIKQPKKEFYFNSKIWFPKNWIVEKHERGKEPQIIKPNVFVEHQPSTQTEKSNKVYYSLRRHVQYKNNTRYPFWRWKNFFLRTWAYVCNSIFLFGIIIPFYSPTSITALLTCEPFFPQKEIDSKTGCIYKRRTYRVLTFAYRIKALWENIFNSRAKFEAQPDKGLIGKTFIRVFNKIWNYLFKGVIGTIAVGIIMPTLCICIPTVSILLALLSPIWYPILSAFIHFCFVLIYDWDSPYKKNENFFVLFHILLWKYLICGLLQPIAAFLTAFGICPLSSLATTLWAFIIKFINVSWDNLMFYLILKPRARIPASDSFVARRISGPGLASNHFFQIKIEQALAALETYLEIEIINSYIECINEIISEPVTKYEAFFNTLLEPFSTSLNIEKSGEYAQLVDKKNRYMEKFTKIANKKKQVLNESISSSDLSKIRLSENDLKILLEKGTEIIKTQYLKYILPYRKNESENEFLRKNNIDDNDWTTYTGIYLEEIFGNGFLTPLEQTDTVFQLNVNHLNLKKYTSMIVNSKLRDDLDLFRIRYNPKNANNTIPMPTPNLNIFDIKNDTNDVVYDYGPSIDTYMRVPLRLPVHPRLLSVLIYNRENKDKQILLERAKRLIEKHSLEENKKSNL